MLLVSPPDTWKELPAEWISGLDIEKDVASPIYRKERNKFGVKSGQGEHLRIVVITKWMCVYLLYSHALSY